VETTVIKGAALYRVLTWELAVFSPSGIQIESTVRVPSTATMAVIGVPLVRTVMVAMWITDGGNVTSIVQCAKMTVRLSAKPSVDIPVFFLSSIMEQSIMNAQRKTTRANIGVLHKSMIKA